MGTVNVRDRYFYYGRWNFILFPYGPYAFPTDSESNWYIIRKLERKIIVMVELYGVNVHDLYIVPVLKSQNYFVESFALREMYYICL